MKAGLPPAPFGKGDEALRIPWGRMLETGRRQGQILGVTVRARDRIRSPGRVGLHEGRVVRSSEGAQHIADDGCDGHIVATRHLPKVQSHRFHPKPTTRIEPLRVVAGHGYAHPGRQCEGPSQTAVVRCEVSATRDGRVSRGAVRDVTLRRATISPRSWHKDITPPTIEVFTR